MDTSNKDQTTMPVIEKKQWLEASIQDHLHCVLCGGELNFQHKTDFIEQKVCESAGCKSCGVRTRQTDHKLQ